MNTFDVKKRNLLSYQEFMKNTDKAEKAKHIEKGEHDIVKKAMDGEKTGDKGIDTLEDPKTISIQEKKSVFKIGDVMGELKIIMTQKKDNVYESDGCFIEFIDVKHNNEVLNSMKGSLSDMGIIFDKLTDSVSEYFNK